MCKIRKEGIYPLCRRHETPADRTNPSRHLQRTRRLIGHPTSEVRYDTVDDISPAVRHIFLIMGNAGFISSTVVL